MAWTLQDHGIFQKGLSRRTGNRIDASNRVAEATPNAGFSSVTPWLPVDPTHHGLAVDLQERTEGSTLQFTRKVIALRQRFDALRTGSITILDAPDPLLVYERGEGEQKLLCAFNLGARPVAWSLPEGWNAIIDVNLNAPLAGELPGLAGLVAQRR